MNKQNLHSDVMNMPKYALIFKKQKKQKHKTARTFLQLQRNSNKHQVILTQKN